MTNSNIDKYIKAGELYSKRNATELHPKALLFDMDGVLFDSMKNHTLAWYQTMNQLHIPCTRDEFYLYEGCTGKHTINRFYRRGYEQDATDSDVERIYKIKSDYFNALPQPMPMPGAKEVLDIVKAHNLKIVLVTGSGQKTLLSRLEHAFPGIFASGNMVTAFDVKHGKPNPEPYLIGLEKANVAANEAIVIENAPKGVEAGRAANIFTIAVNTGPIPDQTLLDSGADLLFPSMTSLKEELETLLKIWNS